MNRNTLSRLVAIPSVVLATAGAAHAALPPAVETAVTGYSTDAGTAFGLVMGAGVVIWGLMKLGRKFGWI